MHSFLGLSQNVLQLSLRHAMKQIHQTNIIFKGLQNGVLSHSIMKFVLPGMYPFHRHQRKNEYRHEFRQSHHHQIFGISLESSIISSDSFFYFVPQVKIIQSNVTQVTWILIKL